MTRSLNDAALTPAMLSAGVLAPAYRWLTVAMVALICMTAFEALAVTTAMPIIAHQLHGLQLYALAFGGPLAGSVVGMSVSGHWADRAGPRPALLGALACFLLGLGLAGTATSMSQLLLGRLAQGVGGGAISVALYALVAQVYPPSLHPRIFAAFSAGWVLPSLLGPGLSAWVVQQWHWRWIFLGVATLLLPLGALLWWSLRGWPIAPERSPTATPASLQLSAAAGTSASLMLLYLVAPSDAGDRPWLLLPALALVAVCAWRLLPEGCFRARAGLPRVIALRALATAAFFTGEAYLPLLLDRQRGLAPLWAGMALSAGALGWFASAWWQGHHRQPSARAWRLRLGMAGVLAGLLLATCAAGPAWPAALALPGWCLTGLGMGLVYPTLSLLTLEAATPGDHGAASSALQSGEAIAVAVALAIAGALCNGLQAALPAQACTAALLLAATIALAGGWIAARWPSL